MQAANNENQALQAKQNQSAWAAYLMSRGVNPNGAETGTIPSNPQAINSKLPLWATWKIPATPGTAGNPGTTTPRRLVRRTAATPAGVFSGGATPGAASTDAAIANSLLP